MGYVEIMKKSLTEILQNFLSISFKSFFVSLSIFVFGCAANTKNHWDEYESLIYSQYHEPGKATPEYQIDKMQADIQVAKSKNKLLPPGYYAHLGYQYLQAGKSGEAKQCFEIEKRQFPESAVLMDRFLRKLR